MTRSTALVAPLTLTLALALFGCGGDKKKAGGDKPDGGGETLCPATAPDREELDPACCYRESNESRSADPTFRLTALNISSPSTLANELITPIINGAIALESFNWLVAVSDADADGPVTITTGLGLRNPTNGAFSFASGSAPGPGDADRWDPVNIPGSIAGEVLSGKVNARLVIPVGSPSEPIVELPLSDVNIKSATMSESRSCIGAITEDGFDTSKGSLETFVRVTDAATIDIEQSPINSNLCTFTAGLQADEVCGDIDVADWPVKPDSLCGDSGCVQGDCDAETECNAWKLTATFSAAGVSIESSDPTDAGDDAN